MFVKSTFQVEMGLYLPRACPYIEFVVVLDRSSKVIFQVLLPEEIMTKNIRLRAYVMRIRNEFPTNLVARLSGDINNSMLLVIRH